MPISRVRGNSTLLLTSGMRLYVNLPACSWSHILGQDLIDISLQRLNAVLTEMLMGATMSPLYIL